jgi:glycosyltransferase involved in cell wall biosynthesis
MTLFGKNGGPLGLSKIALIGSYVPRQCGIATFTFDLRSGMAAASPGLQVDVIAVSDKIGAYDYPAEVRFEIDQLDLGSYHEAANFLNSNGYDAVCIQHEFGIFGGKSGEFILSLVQKLRMPVFVTLHTVLSNPNADQRYVIEELGAACECFTVISEKGAELLQSVHGVPAARIEQIHHGVPGPITVANSNARAWVGDHSKVLLTFGLIGPSKGIESVIHAMPKIVESIPDALYLIVGATHPNVRASQGETYRDYLCALADELGVSKNVRFMNRFLDLSELTEFLALADVYITPYFNEEQISSGTLAYAVGSGTAIISTPYWYAQELLGDGKGLIVPFKSPDAIADAAVSLLVNDEFRAQLESQTLELGRQMLWPAVSTKYVALAERLVRSAQCESRLRAVVELERHRPVAPAFNLTHLRTMTDSVGMLQHAKYTVPNLNEGYAIDDNARALILAAHLLRLESSSGDEASNLVARYLAFVYHAFNRAKGRFRNFMSYERQWLEEIGSDDSHGRTLWSLGFVRNHLAGTIFEAPAAELFEAAVIVSPMLKSPRSMAYSILGLCQSLRVAPDLAAEGYVRLFAERLCRLWDKQSSEDWQWFEPYLTYCNARLPQALLEAGRMLDRHEFTNIGLQSLEWLCNVQTTKEGFFEPVGSSRVFKRGESKPRFDQQPVDAHGTLSACISAWDETGNEIWKDRAYTAFEWFQGFNHLRTLVYDPVTGGCRDGVMAHGLNENQGAESTLSWMLSIAEMRIANLAETCPEEIPAYLS